MGVGASVFLMALGAVFVWGVDASVAGVDLNAIGVVLMIAGLIGLVWSLMLTRRMGARTVVDGRTGEPVDVEPAVGTHTVGDRGRMVV